MTTKKVLRLSAGKRLKALLAPPYPNSAQIRGEYRGRYAVLLVLVLGTIAITGLLFLLLLHSYFAAGNTYVLPRIVLAAVVLVYNGIVYYLARKNRYHLAGFLLVCNYTLYAILSVWTWGTNIPFGIVMMSLSITLAGILLGSHYVLYWTVGLSAILITFQTLQELGLHMPDQSWIVTPANFLHVFGHCVLLGVLGLITWLFGSQMERALFKAITAEAALLEEKQLLAIRLKERTEKLRAAQLKEMQQLYRFAELGQLSTALLHDLANHLTVLTLDIEDLHKSQHSQAIKRAKQSIFYLDRMVDQVRSQLQGSSHTKLFLVADNIKATIAVLKPKLKAGNVHADFTITKRAARAFCHGDPVRFQQIFTILIVNALEAYKKSQLEISERRIVIKMHVDKGVIQIKVLDWGVGIPKSERVKLFKPFYSTKEDGMGIGLFIAHQMIETHFKGKIILSETDLHTEFIITLPKATNHVKPKT